MLRSFLVNPNRRRDVDRKEVEAIVRQLVDCYERSGRAKNHQEREAADAEAKQIITQIGIEAIMTVIGINAHLGRIAIALEKLSQPLPPAQHLFNQS